VGTLTPKEYEVFVQGIVKESFGVDVHHQKSFIGRRSSREIKVDLAFTLQVGGAKFLVVVECKRYKNAVSVQDIEEFHSKLDDIGAHKGIMITTVGFQSGAVKTAEGRGIALALLTDEYQQGELRYVVSSANPIRLPLVPKSSESLVQGNIRGLLDAYQGGLRFENFGQLYGMLCMEFMNKEASP
jgi:restriction system protein